MHNFVHEMLHDSPAAERIKSLWQVRFFCIQESLINDQYINFHGGIHIRNMKMDNRLRLNLSKARPQGSFLSTFN